LLLKYSVFHDSVTDQRVNRLDTETEKLVGVMMEMCKKYNLKVQRYKSTCKDAEKQCETKCSEVS